MLRALPQDPTSPEDSARRPDTSVHAKRWRHRAMVVPAVAGLALLAAACGSTKSSAGTSGTGTSATGTSASGSSASGSATGTTAASGTASGTSGSGSAASAAFETSTTTKSFSATVSALKSSVSSAGMMVLGTLNQAGALSVAGLHLKGAETFFVGNPTVAKKLFSMDPAIGIDLPVRMYVWVSGGKTEVGYLDPASVAAAVNPAFASPAKMLSAKAEAVAKGATGSTPTVAGHVALTVESVHSPKSFSATVSGLKSAVSSAGMMVLGTLNQAGALSVTGLHLDGAESFFVGNPTTGKQLFSMDPAVGMEIPVDLYVSASSSSSSTITYLQPSGIFSGVSHPLASKGAMFNKVAHKIASGAA